MDEYWNLYLDSNPISATFVGVENKKRLNRIWPNVTAAANDAELKQYQGLQNKVCECALRIALDRLLTLYS